MNTPESAPHFIEAIGTDGKPIRYAFNVVAEMDPELRKAVLDSAQANRETREAIDRLVTAMNNRDNTPVPVVRTPEPAPARSNNSLLVPLLGVALALLALILCTGLGGTGLYLGGYDLRSPFDDTDAPVADGPSNIPVPGVVGTTYLPGDALHSFRTPDGRKAVTFFVFNPNTALGRQAIAEGKEKNNAYREEIWVAAKPGHKLPHAKTVCWRKADKDKGVLSGIVTGSPTTDGKDCVLDGNVLDGVKPAKIAANENGGEMTATNLLGVTSPDRWVDIGNGLIAICDPRGARGNATMAPACTLPDGRDDETVANND